LFLPSLEEQAAKGVARVDRLVAVADGEDGFAKLASYINTDAKLAIEKDFVTVTDYEQLLQVFENKTSENITPFIEKVRLSKSTHEVEKTKRAIAITEEALARTLPQIET